MNINSLQLIYQRLLDDLPDAHFRYLYLEFETMPRLLGLVGARGVGKTTLLIQWIKHKVGVEQAFYFSADHILLTQYSIYDVVEYLYLQENIRTVVIDEIHKYKNWSQELKNLYDGFPTLQIVFSGSSSLDLLHGGFDLSRRAVMRTLPGLSFREYLEWTKGIKLSPWSYEDIIKNPRQFNAKVASIPGLINTFKSYLASGYYPFYYEDPIRYHERILNVVDKSIYEDIANFFNLKTSSLDHFKKILHFLVSIPPGVVRVHTLAQHLKIDDKTLLAHLEQLSQTGLVSMVRPAEPGNQGLRRPVKMFLSNSNLHYAINQDILSDIHIGSVRELFFIQSMRAAQVDVYVNKQSDYETKEAVFEIDGKNKTNQQIKQINSAFLVKDDILLATAQEIPLFFFGFMY